MRSIVVTGASTGIGRATVAALVSTGHHVWATVRRDLDARSLREQHGASVTPLIMDLEDDATVAAAGEQVRAAGPLHGLVNNAGAALTGPLEFLPLAVFRRQLDINLVGQLSVTQAMLPALHQAATTARSEGSRPPRIVMIGSVGGRIAGPMVGPYHASKFGIVGLSDSLRAELAPFGIGVVVIEPGSVATPIWERALRSANEVVAAMPPEARRYERQVRASFADAERTAARGIPPERLAAVIVDALSGRNPRPRRLVGRDARLVGVLTRLLPPRLVYRMTVSREAAGTPD